MCVSMDRVHDYSPLVQVIITVALLCVPLAGWLVAITGTIHTALVGIRHLYYPARKQIQEYSQQASKNKSTANALGNTQNCCAPSDLCDHLNVSLNLSLL